MTVAMEIIVFLSFVVFLFAVFLLSLYLLNAGSCHNHIKVSGTPNNIHRVFF